MQDLLPEPETPVEAEHHGEHAIERKGWHPDLIELQLAHAGRNRVRDAYNRAQRLDERRKMMQDWSDYLDGLRAGVNVVPIKRAA